MDAEVYPDARVASFIQQHFLPVKVHIKEQPETFKRFGVQWTPVLVVLDPDGREQHQWEGFLPADEYIGQLELALAKSAFAKEAWPEAERLFREVATKHADADYAPLAVYYAGVSRYKAGDQGALAATGRELQERYPGSSWARKSSVWLPAEPGSDATR
ncbi:MAG TPA: thioredoxin fold domain-containing protein [Anaeromyxobacter sp.]|nr:thioredoxin fold domain-containing protein [Anaeromyxobacter sp.]